jgi:hypothetical protein
MVHILSHMTSVHLPHVYHLKVYFNIIDCLYLGQQSSLFFLHVFRRKCAFIQLFYFYPMHATCRSHPMLLVIRKRKFRIDSEH